MTDHRPRFTALIRDFATAAHAAYMANPAQRLYWYFQPAVPPAWGQFAAMADTPEGSQIVPGNGDWQLADAQPLPRNADLTSMVAWITERARRLPVIGDCP